MTWDQSRVHRASVTQLPVTVVLRRGVHSQSPVHRARGRARRAGTMHQLPHPVVDMGNGGPSSFQRSLWEVTARTKGERPPPVPTS